MPSAMPVACDPSNFNNKGTSLGTWTLETVDQSVNKAKKCLKLTQTTALEVGLPRQRILFSKGVMRSCSTYFTHFSLPTTAYAHQFERTTIRLLLLTREEVQVLRWIFAWCHKPIDAGVELYERNKVFTVGRWCYIWSLADALDIAELRELALDAVRFQYAEENLLPTHRAVQYLYDHQQHHTTQLDSLWSEYVSQHATSPDSTIRETGTALFVPAFVEEVLEVRALESSDSEDEIENGIDGDHLEQCFSDCSVACEATGEGKQHEAESPCDALYVRKIHLIQELGNEKRSDVCSGRAVGGHSLFGLTA